MKLLKPGQVVVINEGLASDPSTRVEGTIGSISIDADLSISYRCRWWIDKTLAQDWFAPNQITELPNAEYIDLQFEAAK